MRQIDNYESIQASSGEFARPTPGGYICQITAVKDVPIDPATGKGDYLKIEYDIASGELKGYYAEAASKFGKWWASFVKSYKEKALGMFKHFTNCVEASNPGYKWNWQEQTLCKKYIGLVIGEEEYRKQDGSVGTRLIVTDVKTVQQIKDGDFRIPALKKLAVTATTVPSSDFAMLTDTTDADLPF